jgi:hypothetical protein
MTARTALALASLCAACALGSCSEEGTELLPITDAAAPPADARPAHPITCGLAAPGPSPETDNPTIPVGLDAYRQWDRWPYLRIGERAYVRSTYDRAGGNEGSDASHFLRLTGDRAIALDVAGTGVLSFWRANEWHGSPWHDVVDGNDFAIEETSTATPADAASTAAFIPPEPFLVPLAWTWPTTAGSDVSGVPIPFAQSLTIGFERSHYGTGYFEYRLFPPCAGNLSQPIEAWSESPPPADVIALLGQAGQDIAPPASTPGVATYSGAIALTPGVLATVLDATGPATLRALSFTASTADAEALGHARLQITWDGRSAPSVSAPVSLFFGAGSLVNRNAREYLVKALPVSIHFLADAVTFAVYFPMPFQRGAHVALLGGSSAAANVTWQARTQPYIDPPSWAGYFHATYVDQGTPTPGRDLILLDTTAVEGGGDWCGQVVGTSFIFSDQASLGTLEGDPRFFFDDSETPQVQGTGTEEWEGGGDYWQGGVQTTLPFYGHPVGSPDLASATSPADAIESAYRFLLADEIPFGKNARLQLEHGGTDDSSEHYRTVAYWYGLPGACLVPTDTLHVSDAADEAAHGYASPDASAVDTLTSRYEWGVDSVASADGGVTVIYPASTDTGRHTTGTSEFTLAIRPDNLGVLLRRKLDYGFPDQRAEVFVADGASETPTFVDAGPWYLAGSSTSVYSNPAGELDPFQPVIETSNRQWRDDELLLPRALTEGKTSLRLRIVFTATGDPLLAGGTPPMQAWSEYRYTAYVWTLPPAP